MSEKITSVEGETQKKIDIITNECEQNKQEVSKSFDEQQKAITIIQTDLDKRMEGVYT